MADDKQPYDLNDDQLDAVTGGGAANVGGISMVDLSTMDLETAMMAVQSNRANLLESQLKSQIEGVQARNEQVAKLNDVLHGGNTALNGAPASAGADYKVTDGKGFVLDAHGRPTGTNIVDTMNAAGIASSPHAFSKGEMEKAINEVKGQIDSLNNSQQMDMLRLQSLSNKRNEAFDVMTNFIKKMQETRSSILGNMR